ncbi:hypothetical protein M3J09_011635 [Ascochyta lentis]
MDLIEDNLRDGGCRVFITPFRTRQLRGGALVHAGKREPE